MGIKDNFQQALRELTGTEKEDTKRERSSIDAMKNAVTGYVAIALGIICFLLALAVIMAVVRIVIGASLASTPNTAATTGGLPQSSNITQVATGIIGGSA